MVVAAAVFGTSIASRVASSSSSTSHISQSTNKLKIALGVCSERLEQLQSYSNALEVSCAMDRASCLALKNDLAEQTQDQGNINSATCSTKEKTTLHDVLPTSSKTTEKETKNDTSNSALTSVTFTEEGEVALFVKEHPYLCMTLYDNKYNDARELFLKHVVIPYHFNIQTHSSRYYSFKECQSLVSTSMSVIEKYYNTLLENGKIELNRCVDDLDECYVERDDLLDEKEQKEEQQSEKTWKEQKEEEHHQSEKTQQPVKESNDSATDVQHDSVTVWVLLALWSHFLVQIIVRDLKTQFNIFLARRVDATSFAGAASNTIREITFDLTHVWYYIVVVGALFFASFQVGLGMVVLVIGIATISYSLCMNVYYGFNKMISWCIHALKWLKLLGIRCMATFAAMPTLEIVAFLILAMFVIPVLVVAFLADSFRLLALHFFAFLV